MRKGPVFIAIGITIVLFLLGVVLFHFAEPSEPSYAGRSLSDWVVEYNDSFYSHTNESQAITTQRHLAARDSITHIGTNAAPFLLKWIQYEPPGWKMKAENYLYNTFGLRISRPSKMGILANTSPEAFGVIAPRLGEDTIDELRRRVNDFTRIGTHKRAVWACSYLGPKGAPILIAAATNCPRFLQSTIINSMQNLGTNGSSAVPVIVKCLQDKTRINGDLMDVQILEDCILALSEIHSEPGLAIPVLVPLLENSRGNVAVYATMALGKFGPAAHSAVPALMKRFNNPNCLYLFDTSNALWQIDPKILESLPKTN